MGVIMKKLLDRLFQLTLVISLVYIGVFRFYLKEIPTTDISNHFNYLYTLLFLPTFYCSIGYCILLLASKRLTFSINSRAKVILSALLTILVVSYFTLISPNCIYFNCYQHSAIAFTINFPVIFMFIGYGCYLCIAD